MDDAEEINEVNETKDKAETEEEKEEKVARIMKAIGGELIDDLQALISEQIKKYHEEKIKRDQGESPDNRPRPGMKPAVKPVIKARLPQALIHQYFSLN